MPNTILFHRTGLARPQVGAEAAAALLKEHYGLEGTSKNWAHSRTAIFAWTQLLAASF